MKRRLFLFDAALGGMLCLVILLSTGVLSFGGDGDDVFGGQRPACGIFGFSTNCTGGTNRGSPLCANRSCLVPNVNGLQRNQQSSTETECGNAPDCGKIAVTKDCVKSGS